MKFKLDNNKPKYTRIIQKLIFILIVLTTWNWDIMATYLFHDHPSLPSSISSSEGWAGQPTLDLPGKSQWPTNLKYS